MTAILFQIQSTLIVLLMTFGILQRKNRKKHVKIMATCITWDILLILQIELSRGAIEKASQGTALATILMIHIGLALSTVILYGFMIYTGRLLLQNKIEVRPRHRILGLCTYIFRILTYITSFWAVNP